MTTVIQAAARAGAVCAVAAAAVARHETGDVLGALKDVSLAVKEGEVLGLIGERRGQDDSAEDMSRITRPTEGWAKIRGKVRQ